MMVFNKRSARAAGLKGGKARAAMQTHKERHLLGIKAGKARAKALTAARRHQIALVAVQARERKRQQKKKGKS